MINNTNIYIWTDYVGPLIGITGLVAQYIKHKNGLFYQIYDSETEYNRVSCMGLLLITDLDKDLTGTLCI